MKIEEFGYFEIEPFEGCEIKCPDCGKWSNHKDWTETEVPCEECGSHDAIQCPKCFENIDHVFAPKLEVR